MRVSLNTCASFERVQIYAHSFDELLAIVTNGAPWKLDFAETDVAVHLLCVLCVER